MPKRKQRTDKGKPRKPYKQVPDNAQSISDASKQETRGNIPMKQEITYEDLSESTRKQIEKSINHRKMLNLTDDSEDRKARAIEYFKWQKEHEGK
jgi:hypothetical protein